MWSLCLGGSPIKEVRFFFIDPRATVIYPLSLHDALPISGRVRQRLRGRDVVEVVAAAAAERSPARGEHQTTYLVWCSPRADRKSTRLNSSHVETSYAVFCLKNKMIMPKSPYRRHGLSSRC